jgi:hypothetical protein
MSDTTMGSSRFTHEIRLAVTPLTVTKKIFKPATEFQSVCLVKSGLGVSA